MATPVERLPSRRKVVNRGALARRQGLVEPLRLSDGITRGRLAELLRDASVEMRNTVLLSGLPGDKAVMEALSNTANKLWSDILSEVSEGVKGAAEMAVNQQLLRDIQVGMPPGLLRRYAESMFASGLQSAEDILSRHTNGFTLSQRVYRNSLTTVTQVGRIVDLGLAKQQSARQIAARVRSFISPATPGGASYAAMRLARTEINNAHHETTIRVTKDRPWVTGYRWHLSGSHPRPDICNTYADEGDGSGNGFFAKGNVPSKPHVSCLCYVEVAQETQEEFVKKLQSKQYDHYLGIESAESKVERFVSKRRR